MAKIKLHSFLFDLFEKSGIDQSDAGLTELLANPALDNIEISQDVTKNVNKNLISVEEAKNNHPAIKGHYYATIMGVVDKNLEKVYNDLELDEDTIDILNSDKSTISRIFNLGERLKKIMDDKTSANPRKPSKEMETLISEKNELNEKLRLEKEQRKADNEKHQSTMNQFRTENILNTKIGGSKTMYDELSSEIKFTSVNSILNKELQDSNATFVLDENGGLKLQKKDGSNYFDENNRQLNVDDFINKTLAKHKVLKQSAPNSEQSGGDPVQPKGQPTQVGGGQKSRINVSSLMAESLQGLEAEPTKMI